MDALSTYDCFRVRGRTMQVWRVTPERLVLMGEWSDPATRKMYPEAVLLRYGHQFLLDGRLAYIVKSAITRAPRVIIERTSHVSATPCPPDLPLVEAAPIDPAGCGDRGD